MKKNLLIVYGIILIAGLCVRPILPSILVLPCYIVLILVPELVLLWFEMKEVADAYDAYKETNKEEKILIVSKVGKKFRSVFHLSYFTALRISRKIYPIRAVSVCGRF